ncbi:MAG TPA: AAA family ATPase, partial [Solirubrobacteraceae bacterium]
MAVGGAELVERDAELAAIADAARAARDGNGASVLLEGPAGIGKSRLLHAACDLAREGGLRVLSARGGELERDFAYGIVRQLLERAVVGAEPAERRRLLAGAAALAEPALGLASRSVNQSPYPGDASFSTMHGLYWVVSNLAESGPLVIAIDDLHWADSPSLRFVAYLTRRLEGLPILVLAAMRTEQPDVDVAVLTEISADPRLATLALSALSEDGVRRLVAEEFAEGGDRAFVAACWRATGGNPFLLRELLAALRADGVRPNAAGASRVGQLGPRTVSHSILARVARLEHPGAAALARATAVLGFEAELSHAAMLANLRLDEAAVAADALASIGILGPGSPLAFSHPIIRTAIYNDVPPGQRSVAHTRAAELLMGQGAAAERVAPHLLATTPGGDARVVAQLRDAAGRAQARGAPDVATRYLRRAAVEPPAPDERGDLLCELGWAEVLSAQFDDGIRDLEEGLALTTDPAVKVERTIELCRGAHSTAGVVAAVDVLERQLATMSDAEPELRLRMEVEIAAIGLLDAETAPRARELLERFVELPGDTPSQRMGLVALALRAALAADRPAAEVARIAQRAARDNLIVDEVGPMGPPTYEALYALIMTDEHAAAGELADAIVTAARIQGSAMGHTSATTLRAFLNLCRGRLVDVEADARIALSAIVANEAITPFTHAVLAEALVDRGELDEAEQVLAESALGPDLFNVVHFNPLFFSRGRLRAAQGRHEEALADFYEMAERNATLGMPNPVRAWWAEAARSHVALGDRDRAEQLVAEHAALARAWGTPSAVGIALR